MDILVHLVPIVPRTQVAVIVLTNNVYRGLWDLAKANGVYACLPKQDTFGRGTG
jgi:hypothetical protein